MRLSWGKEKIKGFSSPVEKAEWNNDWSWWALFGVMVIMEILFLLKVSGKI